MNEGNDMKDKKSRIIFTIIAIICIAVYCASITPKTLQNDTFYTIKIGQYIYENGIGDLTKDMYSWHDLPYTYPHWLYDFGSYLIYRISGWDGIYISTMVQCALLGISLFIVATKLSKDEPISFAITMLAMYMMKPFIAARAQLITFILFVWAVYFIEKFLEKPKLLYALMLVLIPLLITNLHCAVFPFYFVLFLPYIGEYFIAFLLDLKIVPEDFKILFLRIILKLKWIKKKEDFSNAIEELREKKKIRINKRIEKRQQTPYKLIIKKNHNVLLLLIVMIIAGGTGFLNPAGTGAYTYVYKTMQGNTTEHINEHLPLTVINNTEFMASFAIFMGILLLTDRKIRLADFFMFGGLTILALKMQRQVSMYVLFGAIILVRLLHSFFIRFDKKFEEKLTVVCSSLLCSILLLVLVGYISYDQFEAKAHDEYISKSSYPVALCDWILENCDVSSMKIFNEYNYGSYMLFRGVPVFIDSRCDLYTPEFNKDKNNIDMEYGIDYFIDTINIAGLVDDYDYRFNWYGVTHILICPNTKLGVALEKDSNYKELYRDEDNYFVLYQKLTPAKVKGD